MVAQTRMAVAILVADLLRFPRSPSTSRSGSGQSLPFRGIEALGAFHPSVIGKSSLRQRRIVINAAELVRPGGFLLYTTCTFARRENEGVIEWLLHQKPYFSPVSISQFESFQSALTELPMYRLLPQTGIGAGGFTVLLQREGDEPRRKFDFEPIRRI